MSAFKEIPGFARDLPEPAPGSSSSRAPNRTPYGPGTPSPSVGGAWSLGIDAPEVTDAFMLNHLISEVLPAAPDWLQHGGGRLAATLAVLAVFAGILLERWLFPIEGRHVVNLYHDRQRT